MAWRVLRERLGFSLLCLYVAGEWDDHKKFSYYSAVSLHVYMHTSGACKRAVTRVSDVCM